MKTISAKSYLDSIDLDELGEWVATKDYGDGDHPRACGEHSSGNNFQLQALAVRAVLCLFGGEALEFELIHKARMRE